MQTPTAEVVGFRPVMCAHSARPTTVRMLRWAKRDVGLELLNVRHGNRHPALLGLLFILSVGTVKGRVGIEPKGNPLLILAGKSHGGRVRGIRQDF